MSVTYLQLYRLFFSTRKVHSGFKCQFLSAYRCSSYLNAMDQCFTVKFGHRNSRTGNNFDESSIKYVQLKKGGLHISKGNNKIYFSI